jgi:hypothetical protein
VIRRLVLRSHPVLGVLTEGHSSRRPRWRCAGQFHHEAARNRVVYGEPVRLWGVGGLDHDAQAAVVAVVGGRASNPVKVTEGPTEAIRAIEVVSHSAVKDWTRAANQFHSLVVTAPVILRESPRKLRDTENISLTTTAMGLGRTPNDISRPERGLTHNATLAHQQHDWLTQQPD